MTPNNNFNILAWYDSINKQNHRKYYTYGTIWGLISPDNNILPFQFVTDKQTENVTSLIVKDIEGRQVRDITGSISIDITSYVEEDTEYEYDIVMYKGDSPLLFSLPEGPYYLELKRGSKTWYSEVFTAVSNIDCYIKLEYWDNANLYYKGGHIEYLTGFKFACYLRTDIGKPSYPFEEEVTERDGYKFIEKQTSTKVYNMTFDAPEFMCDALRLVRMCDNIRIIDKGEIYKILSFSIDPKWEDVGDVAAVDAEFETDTVVTKIANVLNGPSESGGSSSFNNALLYEKGSPIMFGTGVVAQYQKTVQVVAEGEYTGKLIRELDEYIGDSIPKNAFLAIDLGSGEAKKLAFKNIFMEVNEMYLRKDIDDTAFGNIKFDQSIASTVYLSGQDGKGWHINKDGVSNFGDVLSRGNVLVGNRTGSWQFVSGFPNGIGWDLAPYKRVNAAGVEETKYRLEIDDINVRGKLKAYEFVISQLRGENDNVIFAGMMKVEYYDKESGRIYLDTDKGVLYNPFRSGDIIMVQRYGGMPSAGNNYNVIKQYELRVANAGVGSLTDGENRLDWITFTNFVGELSDIAQGDVLTRVDSVADSTRKGIVKITTIDEIGAPYIDVVYGMKTDPTNATKARVGNLSGIRTKSGVDLTGVWGIYGNGAYFENSTYILDTGNTIEQQFSIMNGKFESEISGIRNDMSLEAGNILRNSSFSQNTNYWITTVDVHFLSVDGSFVYSNYFFAEKAKITDIYQDGSRNVLRIRNGVILQKNEVMNKEAVSVGEGEEEELKTYSFSLYVKPKTAGTLSVGIEGTELYLTQALEPSETYEKIAVEGKWNEKGDFKIAYDGEILVYGVSLFDDALADAYIKLMTRIEQTEEYIKLLATKEYVDSETENITTRFEGELKVQADQISQRVTKTEFDRETGAIKEELEGKITTEAGRITALASRVDNVENDITQVGLDLDAVSGSLSLYVKKNNVINSINVSSEGVQIDASKIDLYGQVTFNMLSSSVQSTINGKVSSSDLGDLAFADKVEKAQLGTTIISGGYIKAELLNVTHIEAVSGHIAGFSIKEGYITGAGSHDAGLIISPGAGIHVSRSDFEVHFAQYGYASSVPSSQPAGLTIINRGRTNAVASKGLVYLQIPNSTSQSDFQQWIECEHSNGWGAEFRVGARYMSDANAMTRCCISALRLLSKPQIERIASAPKFYRVVWEETTGLFGYEY